MGIKTSIAVWSASIGVALLAIAILSSASYILGLELRILELGKARVVFEKDAKHRHAVECRTFVEARREVFLDAYYNPSMGKIVCYSYSPETKMNRWYDLDYIRKMNHQFSPSMKIRKGI